MSSVFDGHCADRNVFVQVYRVSQSGQETEETHLSDTLVNYSNDAQVNFHQFGFCGCVW